MMRNLFATIFLICLTASCNNTSAPHKEHEVSIELTESQKQLQNNGWKLEAPKGGELDERFGVKSNYGLQDNYFDVTVGKGYNVAMKIVNSATMKCIRYIYIPENETVTINEIPQGNYYLKLAYGQDWMILESDSMTYGKFTRKAFYERSISSYNFGEKNSQDFVNYELKINVVDRNTTNNFETQSISEQEFTND